MTKFTSFLVATTATLALSTGASAAVKTGDIAPDVSVVDTAGQMHKLSDFRGKTVVLEWTNADCPYVKKHYGAGNMQALQKEAADEGAVWLSVISSAPGKQGHVSPARADELTTSRSAMPTAVLLDSDGAKGRAYAAKTTPHMYVIKGDGTMAYQGAIDSNGSHDPATIPGATNYVRAALASLKSGTPIAKPVTKAYGCSVKY